MTRLDYVHRVMRGGKIYRYLRYNGHRFSLPDTTDEFCGSFIRAYQEAMRAAEAMEKKAAKRKPAKTRRSVFGRKWAIRVVAKAKYRAAKDGSPFQISADVVLDLLKQQDFKCALTGMEFSNKMSERGGSKRPYAPSIDRLDTSSGYVPENIRLVLVIANYARNAFTDGEFFRMCRAAARNR